MLLAEAVAIVQEPHLRGGGGGGGGGGGNSYYIHLNSNPQDPNLKHYDTENLLSGSEWEGRFATPHLL